LNTVNTLQNQLSDCENGRTNLQNELNSANGTITTLQNDLNTANNTISELQTENEDLQSQLDECKNATSFRSAQADNLKRLPYPNPTNTAINLPYNLEKGETSVMRISSITGQLVEIIQIDFTADKILLNVSGYAKGVYLYEVNGVSNRFIVE